MRYRVGQGNLNPDVERPFENWQNSNLGEVVVELTDGDVADVEVEENSDGGKMGERLWHGREGRRGVGRGKRGLC